MAAEAPDLIMVVDTRNESTQRNSHWRLRFSLKWLFLVMAILCVWLAFYTARNRRAREMVALNDEIVNAIDKNMATEPANATFIMPSGLRHRMNAFLKQTRHDANARREQVLSFFGGGSLYGANIVHVELDVRRVLADQSVETVVIHLLNHYEHGLAETGLNRTINARGGLNGDSAMAVWQIPEQGVSVIVDVVVDLFTKTATIRIVFIQNQRLSLL